MQLDDTHVRMLELLREDGRTSVASLAEQLGISRSNAYTRYEALVRGGVITGVHAEVDPASVGIGVAAMVFITLRQSQWADFRARLSSVAELEYFAVMTGEHDAMLIVRAPDVAAIHELVATRPGPVAVDQGHHDGVHHGRGARPRLAAHGAHREQLGRRFRRTVRHDEVRAHER